MKYIVAFYLCLLVPGGHKFSPYQNSTTASASVPFGNQVKTWWLQKTKKEIMRDEGTFKQFSQSVCNSLRFVKIGLWD